MKIIRLLSLILLAAGTIQVNGATECTGELTPSVINDNIRVPEGTDCMITGGGSTINGNIEVKEGASLKITGEATINGNIVVKEGASLNVMCSSGCSTINGDVKADKAFSVIIVGDAVEKTVVTGKIEVKKASGTGIDGSDAGEVKIVDVDVGGEIKIEDCYLDFLRLIRITMTAGKETIIKNNHVTNFDAEGAKFNGINGAKNIKIESNSFDTAVEIKENQVIENIKFKNNYVTGTACIEDIVSGKKIKVEENEFLLGIKLVNNEATEDIEIKKNKSISTFNVSGNSSGKRIKIEDNVGDVDVEITCVGNTAEDGITAKDNDPPLSTDQCAAPAPTAAPTEACTEKLLGDMTCATGDECCSGFCKRPNEPTPQGDFGIGPVVDYTKCCADDGDACASDAECCAFSSAGKLNVGCDESGKCEDCTDQLQLRDTSCVVNDDCCSGRCDIPLGSSSGSQCCSGIGGKCRIFNDCCKYKQGGTSVNLECRNDGKCYVCFPADATVDVLGKGVVSMDKLAVGDMVRGSQGRYTEIYAFGHRESRVATYVRLMTESSKTLELSRMHQVFIMGSDDNKKSTKFAKDVVVGDVLLTSTAGKASQYSKVVSIDAVVKHGVYNPYTGSGDLYVNGVLASSFSRSPYVAVGSAELISKHHLKHMIFATPRLLCPLLPGMGLCQHDEEGRLVFSVFVDYKFSLFVPNYSDSESNFLAWSAMLPVNVCILLFWILPVHALEMTGLVSGSGLTMILFGIVLFANFRTDKKGRRRLWW